MQGYFEINPEELEGSVFTRIGSNWMLVTAENAGRINTMTASWGGFGVIWGKKAAYIFIRPQRYTKEFLDASDTFSLSFFDNDFKKQLDYLGSVSGRNENKIKKAGLTVLNDQSAPYFDQADTTVFCRKLYVQQFKSECFVDKQIDKELYSAKDFHTLYIGEITKVLKKVGNK